MQAVEDRAGDGRELVDLLWGKPVEDQASDLLAVARDSGFERGAARVGDGGVLGPPGAAVPLDEAARTHPGQLVVQTAFLPFEAPAELNDAQPSVGCLGEGDEHGVVGVGQPAVGLQLLLEAAAQHLLHLEKCPPGDHLVLIQRPRCLLHAHTIRE